MKFKMVISDLDNNGNVHAPWYMGYSYSPWTMLAHVYYIFPINGVVALGRRLWLKIHHSKMDDVAFKVRRLISNAKGKSFRVGTNVGYNHGHTMGYNKGFEAGKEYQQREFTFGLREQIQSVKHDLDYYRRLDDGQQR